MIHVHMQHLHIRRFDHPPDLDVGDPLPHDNTQSVITLVNDLKNPLEIAPPHLVVA